MQQKFVVTDGRAVSTGPLMHEMVNRFFQDMAPFAHFSLPEIFDYLKNIPYRPDPPEMETLMRPSYTLNQRGYGGDCDDKAIAFASWAKLHGGTGIRYKNQIPKNYDYRFVAVRKKDRKNLHHVYPELYYQGKWINCDITYNFNTLGREREHYQEYVVI